MEEYQERQLPQNKIAVVTGLENLLQYHRDRLIGKRVGVVTNHTGVDNNGIPVWQRLSDLPNVTVSALFSPEHGLFGEAAAGEKVRYKDDSPLATRTFSLYGEKKKPTPDMLKNIDLLIYDIQDIGARFYTYISTLGLVLEAAGESNIPVVVLDRPNPITGSLLEGPPLDLNFRSFVGYFPIPIRYGLTPGELATMIINEKWIQSQPKLEVIPLIGWNRQNWFDETTLNWIPTSPNIPDLETALVYPGACLIEATNVSEGRGTEHPFLWVGAPWIDGKILSQRMNQQQLPGVVFRPIEFSPTPLAGVAPHPKYEGSLCHGVEIKVVDRWLFKSVKTGVALLATLKLLYPTEFVVYPEQLDRLFGRDILSKSLEKGVSPQEIVKQYSDDLEKFDQKRKEYFLY